MKAGIYEMIVANEYTTTKLKVTALVEEVGDVDEALGEIQSNFLWETFSFDVKRVGDATVDDEDESINVYTNVEVFTPERNVPAREELTDRLLSFVSDWESDSLAGLVETLLGELSDERLAEFVDEQGVPG